MKFPHNMAISRSQHLGDVNIASLDWSAFQVNEEAVQEWDAQSNSRPLSQAFVVYPRRCGKPGYL
jgi:hypothetical protein